eukprot:gene23443-28759_t
MGQKASSIDVLQQTRKQLTALLKAPTLLPHEAQVQELIDNLVSKVFFDADLVDESLRQQSADLGLHLLALKVLDTPHRALPSKLIFQALTILRQLCASSSVVASLNDPSLRALPILL